MAVFVGASSRLHALISALMSADGGGPLRVAWSQVLEIPEADVQYGENGLPRVATVVAAATDEAHRAESAVGLPLRGDLIAEWSKPVYAPGGNLDGPMQQQRVSSESLSYLDSVAKVLGKIEDQATLPDHQQLSDLLSRVDELARSTHEAAELPEDVKQALLRRIAQLRFVIGNVGVGGPEAVEEAVELLLGAAVLRGQRIPTNTAKKIFAVAALVFTVFSAGPTIQASLEAWPRVVETLTSGPHHEPQAPPDHLLNQPDRSDQPSESDGQPELPADATNAENRQK